MTPCDQLPLVFGPTPYHAVDCEVFAVRFGEPASLSLPVAPFLQRIIWNVGKVTVLFLSDDLPPQPNHLPERFVCWNAALFSEEFPAEIVASVRLHPYPRHAAS